MTNAASEVAVKTLCGQGMVLDPVYFKTAAGGLVQPCSANLANLTSTSAEINELHSQGAVTTDFAKLHALAAIVPSAAAAHAHIVNLTTTATGTEISVAVNAILVAMETFGVNASS